MKYGVIDLDGGDFAVKAGRNKFFTSTRTADRDEAVRSAAAMSAEWHLREALKLLAEMDLDDARSVGHLCNEFIDGVTDRMREEDPNFDPRDPRGWTA